MKTKYYLFGGQPASGAYRWKGYTLPGLTRVAGDTRGLSGDPEMEYLPYRASGPEPLDPGESGLSGIPVWDNLSDNEKIAMTGLLAVGAFFVWKMRKR